MNLFSVSGLIRELQRLDNKKAHLELCEWDKQDIEACKSIYNDLEKIYVKNLRKKIRQNIFGIE